MMTRRVLLSAFALAAACAGDSASGGRDATPPPQLAKAAAAPAAPSAPAPVPVEPPAPLPPAPPGTAYFTPDDITPYFAPDTPAGAAAARFALEDWAGARDGFAVALAAFDKAGAGDPTARARLVYLLALCDAQLGRWAEAAAGFDAAAPGLPLLADYLAYDAARAWYGAGDLDKAAERIAAVAAGSVRDAEARLLAGDILRARSRWQLMAAHYEKYLADFPRGPRVSEARLRLAEAYTRLGKPPEVIAGPYRAITIEDPVGAHVDVAQAELDAIVKKLPKKKRAKLTTRTAAEHARRGFELFDAKRNPEAEKEYAAALAAPDLDAKQRCEYTYQLAYSVFNQRQRLRSAGLFEQAMALCAKTDNVELQVKSAYQAGRAYQYQPADDLDSINKSIERFAQCEREHPDHSFADDARLRQAEGWAKLPRTAETDAKIIELLGEIPRRYPQGDMKTEALWRLAFRDWKDGNHERMLTWLDQAIAVVPHEYGLYNEGQPYYWKGRAYEKLGKKAEALEAYRAGARKYPLAYYTLLGLNRLREGWPKEYAALVEELKRPPADWRPGTPVWSFKPRAAFADPAFARAVELLRLGLGDDAGRELSRAGLKPPSDRKRVEDPDRAEEVWAIALLYDRAKRYDKSHWIGRWNVLDYRTAWPHPGNRERWDIAYPKAWWSLLSDAAQQQGYPAELLISFVRTESAFNPLVESWANAIGLTQMIKPTAERFGRELGFPMTRENLRDPAKNVAVGSRFLAFLVRTFDGRIQLIAPAYNAGEGAVWRWLCERGTWAADEFAEAIAGDEPRNYTKTVLHTYFVYSWLRDNTVPVVPNDIPGHVINAKKCKK